jgi:hypothetical protein
VSGHIEKRVSEKCITLKTTIKIVYDITIFYYYIFAKFNPFIRTHGSIVGWGTMLQADSQWEITGFFN